MKKCIPALLFMLALSVPAFAKSYVNGIDANYPPFAYIDEKSGKPSGYDVEAMDWIAKAMGFEVKHVPIAWDGIIPTLLAKKIDMICSGMSITPARAQQVTFSTPYWKKNRVFVVKQDSKLTASEIMSTKIRIGGQRGTNEAASLMEEQKAKNLPFEVRLYESAPLMVEDLLIGRITAALMDSPPAQDSISKGKAIKIAGVYGEPTFFGVAMRKEDTELQNLVNGGYKKLLADPFWKELQRKYGVKPLE